MMKTLVIMSLVVHLHQETRLTTRRQNLVLIPIRKSRGKTSMRESFMNLQNSLFVFSLQPFTDDSFPHFRPMEISSKRPVSRRRTVVDVPKIVRLLNLIPKHCCPHTNLTIWPRNFAIHDFLLCLEHLTIRNSRNHTVSLHPYKRMKSPSYAHLWQGQENFSQILLLI